MPNGPRVSEEEKMLFYLVEFFTFFYVIIAYEDITKLIDIIKNGHIITKENYICQTYKSKYKLIKIILGNLFKLNIVRNF